MKNNLRTLFNVAYKEWIIQIRQRTTWLIAGLFFLVGWAFLEQGSLPLRSAMGIAINIADGLGAFGTFFVAILASTALLREIQPGYDLIWTHSFSTTAYFIGKYLGVVLTIITALLPSGLLAAYLMGTLHGFETILIQIRLWLINLGPTYLFIIAVTFLVGSLFRRGLWTTLFMVLFLGGVMIFNQNFTRTAAFDIVDPYASPLIGYGPDSGMILLNRIFYLALSALLLLMGLLIVRISAPRREQKISYIQIAIFTLLAAGLLAGLIRTATIFKKESHFAFEEPPADPFANETIDCALLNSFNLDVLLDQDSKQVSGRAIIELPITDTLLQLTLGLNSGLQVLQVEATPPETKVELLEDGFTLNFPAESIGTTASLTINYSGDIRIPRYLYDNLFRTEKLVIGPFPPGGYLDKSTVFLERDGNWHPFPNCVPETLKVELAGDFGPMLHTADGIESSDGRTTLMWTEPPPQALLAASQNYQSSQIDTTVTLFMAPNSIPEDQINTVYSPYSVLLSEINAHLEEKDAGNKRMDQIAIVPLISYDSYDSSSGVYFLPEKRRLDDRFLLKLSANSQKLISNPELLYPRWVAEQMIRAWWCSSNACPRVQANVFDIWHYEKDWVENQAVLNALLTYSSLRLSEPLTGQDFVDEEIASRQSMVNDPMRYMERAMFIELPMIDSLTVDSLIIRLDTLWQQVGPAEFWQLVRDYRNTYGISSPSEDEFSRFVEQVTGMNFE